VSATWDAAYCLGVFNRLAGRPATDAAIGDPQKYQWLSEAQNEIVGAIAGICPNVLYPTVAYGSLPTLTTSDNQVFTFGTDSNGYAVTPIGRTKIFRSLNDLPDWPMRPGVDYLPEGGTAIRIPNNGTYTGTLYWLGITNPPDIDATHQPSLFPEASRELIPVLAVKNFTEAANRNPDLAATMLRRLGSPWAPSYPGAFARWCQTWRTQFAGGGALGTWSGLQLALMSQ
jgi:hypothetical protein